ncbi:hypothetical protein HHI36_009918, partial [Cryptolaemus montrouzieri]
IELKTILESRYKERGVVPEIPPRIVYYAIRQRKLHSDNGERSDYIEKAEVLLGDVSTYTKLSRDPTSATPTKFNDLIMKFRDKGEISDELAKKLII